MHPARREVRGPRCGETTCAEDIEPPTFNGKGDFREWKRKLELCYEAKVLTDEEKLVWTRNLLQDGASRVANQARPDDYNTLVRNLTRLYTDGNDEFHYRNALSENRQTGSIEDYVIRFIDLYSRVPNLPDADAKFALVKGLKPEVQIHMLGQHHVNSPAEALEELRVYGHARRGTHTTGT